MTLRLIKDILTGPRTKIAIGKPFQKKRIFFHHILLRKPKQKGYKNFQNPHQKTPRHF